MSGTLLAAVATRSDSDKPCLRGTYRPGRRHSGPKLRLASKLLSNPGQVTHPFCFGALTRTKARREESSMHDSLWRDQIRMGFSLNERGQGYSRSVAEAGLTAGQVTAGMQGPVQTPSWLWNCQACTPQCSLIRVHIHPPVSTTRRGQRFPTGQLKHPAPQGLFAQYQQDTASATDLRSSGPASECSH